jgi:hypothetical protein
MNQDRLDELENRVEHLEEGNGWHEWGKYVLKKLDELNDSHKESRKELGKKMEDLEEQNTTAHRELHRKMDEQNKVCAARPMQCSQNFVQGRTVHWLIIILTLVIGGMSALGIAHITDVEKHVVTPPAIEQSLEIDTPVIE